MATRQAITKAQATRYRSGSRVVKSEILDSVWVSFSEAAPVIETVRQPHGARPSG